MFLPEADKNIYISVVVEGKKRKRVIKYGMISGLTPDVTVKIQLKWFRLFFHLFILIFKYSN